MKQLMFRTRVVRCIWRLPVREYHYKAHKFTAYGDRKASAVCVRCGEPKAEAQIRAQLQEGN